MGRLLIAICVVLVGGACTGGGNGERPDPSPTIPEDVFRSPKPSAPASIGQELSGTLGYEEIEGGCPYLESADGTRHQVIYPEGWELQRGPVRLVSPEGEVMAEIGDPVTVRGMPASDMASICQIGPIFRATEVISP